MDTVPAAFGRLCVETMKKVNLQKILFLQPPSGGCVLKPIHDFKKRWNNHPAAFGRLCVETEHLMFFVLNIAPAAFGRLCVETSP